ncbi:hypothetical protein Tco_1149212 [Tanacetum coccineum]
MNVTGACRVDERLKPLLNKVSSEDRLLSHLTQHFDLSEVGLLARCLCIPLVSLRVGRITKQGALLVPTTARDSATIKYFNALDQNFADLAYEVLLYLVEHRSGSRDAVDGFLFSPNHLPYMVYEQRL